MPRNLINQALRPRPNSQHRQTPWINLRPARILNHLSRKTHVQSLPPQFRQLLLALDLDGNLGLAALLPALEQLRLWTVGVGAHEGLVAGEGGVGALGGDFACRWMVFELVLVLFFSSWLVFEWMEKTDVWHIYI